MKILPKANVDAEEADVVVIKIIEVATKVNAAATKVNVEATKVNVEATNLNAIVTKVYAEATKVNAAVTKVTDHKLCNTQTRTSRIMRGLRHLNTIIKPIIKEAEVFVQILVVKMAYLRAFKHQKLARTQNKDRNQITGVADEVGDKKIATSNMAVTKANKEGAMSNLGAIMKAKEAVTEDNVAAKEAAMKAKLQ